MNEIVAVFIFSRNGTKF